MPQKNNATLTYDKDYGLEPAGAPASDDQYGLEPAGAAHDAAIPDAAAQAHEAAQKPLKTAVRGLEMDERTPWYNRPAAGFHMAADRLAQRRDQAEAQRLHRVGQGEDPDNSGHFDPAAALDLGSRTLHTVGGLVEPKSLGIMAAGAVAPEIVGPALVVHGLHTAGTHAKGAIEGKPEEVGAALSGLSEASGGGAMTGAGFGSWGTKTATPIGKGAGLVKQITGRARLTPVEASATPAAAEFQPALGVTPAEVLHHAAKEGINLTPGQATKFPVSKMVQALGERDLSGSGKLTEGIDRNAAALMKSVTNFADRVDPKKLGTSDEAAGEAIRQSTEIAKDVSHENASNAYKNLAKFDVDPKPIADAWIKNRGALPTGVEDAILAKVPRDMKAHVAEIMDPSGTAPKLTSDQAIGLRSLFLDLGRTVGADLPTRAQGIFKTMSKAADSALETDAKAAGAEKEWRDANAGWKAHVEKYGDKSSPLYRILDQADPKKISRDLMSRRSAADVELLKNEKLDPAIEALRGRVISDIARQKFSVGREGLAGYSHAFLNTLFGPEAVHELYLKGELGRRFNFQLNPSGTSNVILGESQLVHPTPSKLGLMAGSSRLSMPRAATDFLPEHVYRARDVGNPTIGRRGPHATMSLEDAQRLAPGRGATTGNPQEISRIRLSRFAPHEYEIGKGGADAPWIKFNRQLTPEDYAPLESEKAPGRLAPIGTATAAGSSRRRLPRFAGKSK